jgi:hypothetical protein
MANCGNYKNNKLIYVRIIMEKSKFKRLIKGMVFEMLEGKGDAPGATQKTSLATPGSVSKGGFTLQDFNSVLSGVAGERSGRSGSRSSKRESEA